MSSKATRILMVILCLVQIGIMLGRLYGPIETTNWGMAWSHVCITFGCTILVFALTRGK